MDEQKVTIQERLLAFVKGPSFVGLMIAIVSYWFGPAGLKWFNLSWPVIQDVVAMLVTSGFGLALVGRLTSAGKAVRLKKAVKKVESLQDTREDLLKRLEALEATEVVKTPVRKKP